MSALFLPKTLALPDQALLLAIRPPPHDLTSLQRLDDAEWETLAARATTANLASLLFYTLRHAGLVELAPASVRQHLSAQYYASARRQLVFSSALAEALDALRTAGIVPILLKGIVLAETTYPDAGLRPMTDIDLLVHAQDVPSIYQALQQLGYHAGVSAAQANAEFFNGELSFAKAATTDTLTLEFHQGLVHHWNFTAPLALDSAALWQRAQPLTLAGHTALQLAPEDMLLHLCLHRGLHHGFTGLPGYVDIAWMTAIHGARLDWDALIARAHAAQARVIVFLALQLAHDLLGAAVPAAVLRALAPSPWRQRLLRRLVDLELILHVDIHPTQEDAGRALNVLVIDSAPGVLRWIRQRLFPGVRWQKAHYALDSTLHAYAYASLIHPLRILGGFAARAARLLLRNKSLSQFRS